MSLTNVSSNIWPRKAVIGDWLIRRAVVVGLVACILFWILVVTAISLAM